MKKHKILDKRRLMKNTTSVMSIFVASLLIFLGAVSATTSINNTMTMNDEKIKTNQQGIADISPNIDPITPSVGLAPTPLTLSQQNNQQPLDMWDLLFSFDVATASGAAGNAGAHCVDEYFYSARWASNLQHQYDLEGNLLKEYSISGVSGICDLAYDGDYLYGGPASGTIWGWDPIGETLESTITGGFQCRAIGFDDDKDTFYVSNWGDPVWEVDREGSIVDSFNLALTTSTYGFAYDQWSDSEGYDGPFMWVYDQGGTGAIIHQWDLASGAFTGVEHDTEVEFPNVIAGGLFLTEEFDPGHARLGGLGQGSGDPMFVYDIDLYWWSRDVGVKNIISPENGYAGEDMDVIVQVKNYGNNTEKDIPVNVVILKDGFDEEYNETEYIDSIKYGETVDVEMPVWTPDDWQSASNEYIDYNITAYTALQGDTKPSNDYKEKCFELYFGYFHDVGCTDVSGPETGPAQTFPVTGHIKNFGQYDECCFKTYVEIAEIDYSNTSVLWIEDFELGSGNTPPPGWDTGNSSPYAWNWSSYSLYLPSPYGSGISTRCYWSYSDDAELISPVIDTSSAGYLEANWGMYYYHFTGDYELYVDIRPNPDEPWTEIQPWDNPVNGNMGPDWYTADATIGIGTETQLRFRTGGYYYNMDYWFFDNLEIMGYGVKEPEFEDELCITEIDPGEEVELNFDDWTPEFLAEETTGTKKYIVKCWTELEDPEDENPDNDLFNKFVELDFYHDVGFREITSPSIEKIQLPEFYAVDSSGNLVWYDPETGFHIIGSFPSTQFPQGGTFVDDVWWICDTIGNIWKVDVETGATTSVGNSGTGELVDIEYDPKENSLWGISTKSFYEIDMETGAATLIGGMGNPSLMISIAADIRGNVWGLELGFAGGNFYSIDPSTGQVTLIGNTGVSMTNGRIEYDKNTDIMWYIGFNYATFQGEIWTIDVTNGATTFIYTIPGYFPTSCMAIPYSPMFSPSTYVPLGSQNIETIVENIGTFPELDLVCYAEIYEYITNCTNGTLVYADNISDIDLDVPLGGTETLNFDSYNFATEGTYGLFLNLPDDNDDYTSNNDEKLGIGADGTPPNSTYYLNPPEPDGENGWYVSDVEVTIFATDPEIGCGHPGSGVKEINYKIGSSSWQTLPGMCGTFIIDVDDEDFTLDYYAVDNVGNEESINSFTIDIDQTVPDIEEVTWEIFQDPPIYGPWYVIFTCDAVDATSGMDRVEMYINEGFCEEIIGGGPIYEFTIQWSSILKTVVFTFEHYDRAGNMIENYIDGGHITAYPYIHKQQQNPVSRPRTIHQNNN